MSSPSILTLLSLLMVTEVSSVNETNCSYTHLLEHLNLLDTNQVLANVRPVVNWTSPTEVNMDLYVYGILDVDEKSQTLTCQAWINTGWLNEFLSWNESDFCGIDKLAVPRKKLWTPDIYIQEDISSTDSITKGPFASLYSNGIVTVMDSLRLTTACNMDLYKFPFDTQTCQMTVTSISQCGRLGDTHFLIPLLYFLVLDLASFFINQTSGEKLSFKITILLSISVLLLLFNDILPSTASKLPLIASYCVVVFTLVGFNLLVTLLVGFLMDLDRKEGWGQTHASVQSSPPENEAEKGVPAEASPEQRAPGGGMQGLSDPRLLQLALEEVWRIRLEVASAAKAGDTEDKPAGAGDQGKTGYWERVASRIDTAYFCIYIIFIIVFHGFLYIIRLAGLLIGRLRCDAVQTADATSQGYADPCEVFLSLELDLHDGWRAAVLAGSDGPVRNLTTRTQVKVDMFLLGILDVNAKSQTFTCSISTLISWNNEFISWDPKEFCGKFSIQVPREKLWKPDIVIHEETFLLRSISDTGSTKPSRYARLFPGQVQVMDQKKLTTSCGMDMYKFPLDVQICTVTFLSLLIQDEITLGSLTTEDYKNKFTRKNLNQGEWDFLFMTTTKNNFTIDGVVWSQLEYKIHIQRRPQLYLLNLAMPIVLFLVLNLASFFINQTSGEKLSFKITILLSISVLLLILNDILPSTGDKLPLIALHCSTIFFMVGLSLLESILMGFLGDLDSKGCQDSSGGNGDPQILSSATGGTAQEKNPHLEEVEEVPLEERSDDQRKVTGGAGDHREPGYWGRVARGINKAYFCFYLFSTVVFFIYVTLQWFL
ncbi:5-hydroxytryptamine receptor 3B-like [Hypomesus transpacificus]|uniref:5-hydroxytryptamine receptor 3B-like n=1 Tax=Hypomesus transpacificus TaxID=137520 RepID=UPI001F082536|nr:5-hydroxytryptamine receptor 3B-like [Hypomesus transpacificus]